ncbi:MAG: 3alpha(or 20beta)-hydroxysteroid dehydrogenase [Actinomycetota bacterium]|jgi:3alpha(or 20beta)-hydroxysteroid dehydrogenase|nr:3alpha(or 20beta)-hydroxysteroid dehydrogenase [Actinomycetota bacterium]
MKLDGEVALVTGGARGMGETHSRALVAEGARVVIADILDEEGEALAASLGDAASYVHLDVTQERSWMDAIAAAEQAFGTVSILVNNAGIANAGPFEQYSLDLWNQIIAVNQTGVFLGIKSVVAGMKKLRRGSIINISSVEGLRGGAYLHGYVASKFAVRGLTKSASQELGGFGIRVNSVHPGYIETPMTADIDPKQLQIPMHRSGKPEEVSKMIVFLASSDSSYSTGAEFVVDGGMTAGIPHRTGA